MIERRPFLALTAAVIAAFGASHAVAAETVRIGDINSYTRMAAFTEPYRKGLELALEQINAKGGIGGRQLELVSRDDGGEPGEAVKIAEEMLARDQVAILTGGFFSNVGLALASLAKQRRVLYIAGEPLADALTWQQGNRYTYRLRPSTWMQAAMLAEVAAKHPAKRWATIAPNYAYGKEAVVAFRQVMGQRRPDIEWVGEQWPPLFKIDAGAEAQALAAANPEAIYNVTFGSDLAKLVREGTDRGLFEGKLVVSLLGGEPEYIDPLGEDTPEGWLVTGYPWSRIATPEHKAFVEAYQAKWDDYPRLGSVVGYNVMLTVGALLEETGGNTGTKALLDAMDGLGVETPFGPIAFRPQDHQATMGAFVGYTTVEDGKGTMRDWHYADGADYLPGDAEVAKLRPADD
jgi:branched-chain amino acid transport system substrate-binding protein